MGRFVIILMRVCQEGALRTYRDRWKDGFAMSRWNLSWILGVSAVVLLGYTVSHSAPPKERDRDYELVKLVVDVLEEVDHKYVRPWNPIKALCRRHDQWRSRALDPHSGFISSRDTSDSCSTTRQVRRHRHSGPSERKNGRHWKSAVRWSTPAYEAGVQAGDLIVKIDGKATESMRVKPST